jgi:hypothetical protein
MVKQYINDYEQFLKSSPWYYRLTRFFFKEQLFGKDGEKTFDFTLKEEARYFSGQKSILSLFSQTKNRFICWLVGLNLLLKKTETLQDFSQTEQLYVQQKKELNEELSKLRNERLVSSSSINSNLVETNLVQRATSIGALPNISYQPMPFIFERFGRNNEIIAAARIKAGQPMTYSNLVAEKKAALAAIEQARLSMLARSDASRSTHAWVFFPPPRFDAAYDPLPHNENAGKLDSDIIDGAVAVIGYIDKELTSLSERVAGLAPTRG